MTQTPANHPSSMNTSSDEIQRQVDSVGRMLSSLDDAPADPLSPQAVLENRLIAVRLGMASSLFNALRVRHKPTANHSLRVAILCTRWSLATDLNDRARDELEVAALLHDIGKIGAPDSILQKPGALDTNEAAQLSESRLKSLEILSACATGTEIPKIVAYSSAWYDGRQGEFQLKGNQIPIAARMIAIADAFDAMTTDRIYRKAIAKEQAIEELQQCAGSQFDPVLVQHFAAVQANGQMTEPGGAARRWLTSLDQEQSDKMWRLGVPNRYFQPQRQEDTFHQGLLDALPDGIMYVDSQGVITHWSTTIQELTAIKDQSVKQTRWDPYLVKMRWSDTGESVRENECPILNCLKTGVTAERQILIKGANGEHMPVNLLTVPILDSERSRLGVAAMFRDATEETNLHHRVEKLHKKATLDPLTKLANRAEFDRFHGQSIRSHEKDGRPSSLIICDIDRFKSINDKFGHQAGDEALVSFAQILNKHCQAGDLVARYGGEEFVMVCLNCSAEKASKLAEKMRTELSVTAMKELNNQCITASFGVTEQQPGDTMETMLRRADRGLLEAKDTGRNRVICLGSGMEKSDDNKSWWSWITDATTSTDNNDSPLADCVLVTNVPVPIVSEKLKGFIADHAASILDAKENQVVLKINSQDGGRRRSERGGSFTMTILFNKDEESPKASRTIVRASLSNNGRPDRRARQQDAASSLLRSLKSYLVAQYLEED